MTTIEILKKARDLLSDPARWTQGGGQRNDAGALVNWDAPDIACRCAWQTLRFAAQSDMQRALKHAEVFYGALGFQTLTELVAWNDAPERTHAEVLQRFDEALARLEAAG